MKGRDANPLHRLDNEVDKVVTANPLVQIRRQKETLRTVIIAKIVHAHVYQTVEKSDRLLQHSVPPGYQRNRPPARSKLCAFIPVIDQILEEDKTGIKKQRHTAKRIHAILLHGSPNSAR